MSNNIFNIHSPRVTARTHLEKLGIKSKFANGMRITDPESIHIIEI